jgi:hypothetical protein
VKPAPGGPSVPSQVSFWAKSSQKFIGSVKPVSQTKLKQFAETTPHPLLLDHSMALVCDQ